MRSVTSRTAALFASCLMGCAMLMVTGCVSDTTGSHSAAVNAPASGNGSADFEAASKRPPTARTLYTMARILATQGKDAEAEFFFRRIIREHPEFPPAYCDLAETLLRQRRLDEAQHFLRAGLAIAPRDAVLINDLGMCMLLRGDYEQALVRFTKAAGIAPDDARFRSNMAVALGMMGRYNESLALYRLVLPPSDAHYNLGVLCDARHDSTRAATEFHEAQVLKAAADAGHGAVQEAEAQKSSELKIPATTRPTG